MSTTIIDLSQDIETGMQLFPLHSPTHVVPWMPREQYGWATNALFLNEHAGTHLDAPFHFMADGQTIDHVALERLTGPAVALDFSTRWPKGTITAADLEEAMAVVTPHVGREDAVLLRTGAEDHLGEPAYLDAYPGLSADGAELLVARGVRLVGTDAASIDHPEASDFPAHHRLLPGGTFVVENLTNLGELLRLTRGLRFTLHTFPLRIKGGTGSPIRAVAIVS